MENNAPILNKMPETNTVTNESPIMVSPKKLTKKKRIIIIIAILALVSLLITYLFISKIKEPERIPTIEEKIQNIENTVSETAKIGLPDEKVQLDIMNYNQTE